MGWERDGISGSSSTSLCSFASGAATQATGGAVPNLVTWRCWGHPQHFAMFHSLFHLTWYKLQFKVSTHRLYVSIHLCTKWDIHKYHLFRCQSIYRILSDTTVRLWCMEGRPLGHKPLKQMSWMPASRHVTPADVMDDLYAKCIQWSADIYIYILINKTIYIYRYIYIHTYIHT